ncbi:hypothetical protein JZ751_018505 [Albula glossodonta]|uniref:G-protein coupled receptors family 1 profile domain-containing protein n=1 Tax=Albula glossodonta TaxID=121402 RepID=A0A8T2NLV9_9TELE|nr:hypothetical protein JZ751_018505 [Albula glossodonta]
MNDTTISLPTMGENLNQTTFPNMSSNGTSKDGNTAQMHAVTLAVYCVTFLLGTTGNGLVIYVTGFKMRKTVNSIWFLNLAVADFLFTAFLPFSIVNLSRGADWPFGDFMCKFNSLVTVLNMFTSIFLLTAISLDRCLATWVVVWAKNKRTPRKVEVVCIIIWLAALGCSLPYTVFRTTASKGNKTKCINKIDKITYNQLAIIRFVIGFLIPFLIIVSSYVAIALRVRSLQRQRKYKSIRTIVAVILAFFFCWLPFHIIYFLEFNSRVLTPNPAFRKAMRIALPLSFSLATLNSCMNPLLYVFMCKDFKRKLRQSVLLNFGRQNMMQATNLSSNGTSQDGNTAQMHAVTLAVYCVTFLLGTTGNGLVIYVTGFKMRKTVNSIWFFNLAVADFLFTAFLPFSIVYLSRGADWPFGDFMCKFNSLVTVLNMFTSIFLLAAISIDRGVSTWMVVWAKNNRTPRKVEIACAVIWLGALGCSLPYTVFRVTKTEGSRTVCSLSTGANTYVGLMIFKFVMGFLIPFLVIISSYVSIGVRVRSLKKQKTNKPTQIIVAVILAFFFCWLPFHILSFLDFMKRVNTTILLSRRAIRIALPLSFSLATLNSCMNPLLYVFMCKDFKQKLHQSVLLVLEGAFTDESLMSRSSTSKPRPSLNSQGLGPEKRNDTATSLL